MCQDFDVGQARVNPTVGGVFVYGQKAGEGVDSTTPTFTSSQTIQ